MSVKKSTLSEKLNALLAKSGVDGQSEESENESAPRVTEFDQNEYQLPEARTTEFRKKNVKLLSEQSSRYRGKLSSRKEINADESNSCSDSNEEDNETDKATLNEDEEKDFSAEEAASSEYENEGTANSENESGSNDDDEDEEEDDESESGEEDDVDNGHKSKVIKKANSEAEIRKGGCVQNQIRIWERLLELRIQSQKLISKANSLPSTEAWPSKAENVDLQLAVKETTGSISKLLRSCIELQSVLTNQFTEFKQNIKGNPNETQMFLQTFNEFTGPPPLKRFAGLLESRHRNINDYRNTVLLKWDDRTKLLTPSSGSKRKAEESFDIIRKIESALSNSGALIEKSRILRSKEQLANVNATTADGDMQDVDVNRNIYDDSDFYHQQLRELIEYKANNSSTASEITRQYVELQSIRQKMKKQIDQRASKGRKLRYTVHNKLINFMAPDDSSSTWSDEAKDELYKSLFIS